MAEYCISVFQSGGDRPDTARLAAIWAQMMRETAPDDPVQDAGRAGD